MKRIVKPGQITKADLDEHWARKFNITQFLFDKQLAFVEDPAPFKVAVCSRRAGKCRPVGTLVKTPTGSVPIEQLKPGDAVYGYNADGTVSLTTVTALWDQGVKDVVDLVHNNTVIASSTVDHKWLAHNTHRDKRQVKPLKEFNSRDRIAQEYVAIPGGNIAMPYAYTLGATIGDGCSREHGFVISGQDSEILNAVGAEVGKDWKHSGQNNYTNRFNDVDKTKIPYYNQWVNKRYAHEKICDVSVIRQWDRQSQLEFLAGLIDTDGSVSVSKDKRLVIRLGMQAKVVIDAVELLLLDLFQVQACKSVDNRDKYKNGSVYNLRVSKNRDSKRILKELPTKVARKQWKSEYSLLEERNTNSKYSGFTIANPRKEQCYDITIDNETHLFLDANGLVGHNTTACAAHLISTAINNPETLSVYITLTGTSGKRIIWNEFKKIVNHFKLPAKINDLSLSIEFPNGASVIVIGAKDETEIEKIRGIGIKLCYIDECQSFKSYIEDLIDDIIGPALMDYAGSLCLIGTPSPIPSGYFHKCWAAAEGWSKHTWTFWDNPHIPVKSKMTHQQVFDREMIRSGRKITDPSVRREFFGEWETDKDSLLIKYDTMKNHYETLPQGPYNYIMGIDIGHEDADAIAILAWNEKDPTTYLVEELITPKQDITALADQIKMMDKKYQVSKMIMDMGALGKKIGEELIRRHQIPVEAADKTRKMENVAFLNDALRTSMFKAKKDSRFVQDTYLVEIDRDKSTPDRIRVSDRFHSDIIDAVLYGFKVSPAYAWEPPKPPPKPGSKEWLDAQSSEMWEAELEGYRNAEDLKKEYGDY